VTREEMLRIFRHRAVVGLCPKCGSQLHFSTEYNGMGTCCPRCTPELVGCKLPIKRPEFSVACELALKELQDPSWPPPIWAQFPEADS